jgi:hypothetical protein
MTRQRISYVPLEKMTPEMRAEMERCARAGAAPKKHMCARVPGSFAFRGRRVP